jgi:FkbH-like protein
MADIAVGEKQEIKAKEIKCIVWDLDNTIWNGILAEGDNVALKPGIAEIVKELDGRGILQSIASKNNYDSAISKLGQFGMDHYFLYPEIHWNAKSESVGRIQKALNIGIDTFMFVDDQVFERDEVSFAHPSVECIDSLDYGKLLEHPRLNPRFITEDSRRRRLMYKEDIVRNLEEKGHGGTPESFLASLGMKLLITEATEDDLKRAEELTVRTHQLNATGITYDYAQLDVFRKSDDHLLIICELADKYGSYGKIGLSLVEIGDTGWNIKLFLMSCRVMNRGVGTVLMTVIMKKALAAGKKLYANFRLTDKNKQMYIAYKFANFKEKEKNADGTVVFENDLSILNPIPSYIDCIERIPTKKN